MEFRFIDPVSDFSEGLSVIRAYHCDFLLKGRDLLALADEIVEQEMHEALANRCVEMYRHYYLANQLHHLDEEQGLFPLIAERSQLMIGMVDLLIQDHQEIEEDWDIVAQFLGKPELIRDPEQFRESVILFEKDQREHLIREDEDFLPKVDELLSPAENQRAGAIMAKLRKRF